MRMGMMLVQEDKKHIVVDESKPTGFRKYLYDTYGVLPNKSETGSGKFDLDWTVYCMLSKEEKNKNNW